MDVDSIPLLMAWMRTNDSQGNGAEHFSESTICHIEYTHILSNQILL